MKNTLNHKIVSIMLSATTLLSLSGAILPVVAQAQTTSDLQAQIAALLSQIQQLQSKLNSGSSMSASYNFTRDLTVGSKGNDVMDLQKFLNSHGVLVSGSGVGSPGNESTYFGALTKAALAQWQGSNGVSPAVGYFGPKTRAAVSAMAVSPSPSPTPTPSPSPTPTGTPSPMAPASGLVVSLASDNPAPGSLIPASSRNKVLRVTFTAGNASAVTISEIKFKKVGVLSDSSVSGAYISESGKVLAQYNSISAGVISFSNLSLSVGAGQSRTFSLAIDPAAGLSAGNTVAFSLNSAADVTSWDSANNAVAEAGVFPISGNIFTVTTVSNPSLATLAIASSSIGTQVTAGMTNNLVAAWNFTVGNSKLNLSSIKFTVIGSANKADLKNVKLMVNGNQVGATLASLSSNGDAFFDASAAPGVLNTGSNNVQLYADVMGSPSYNFQFEILNSYDVYALDSQYNIPVLAASNVGTLVSIKTGTITVSQASNTPTGNVAAGQSSVVIAKFNVTAAGEAVKIKWLGIGLNISGASGTIDSLFKNLSLVDDAGSQVGTTINTLSTVVTCTDTAFTVAGANAGNYRNCLGNSSSPINYTVPANTTRVLSMLADVQSATSSANGTTFSTVVGVLTANTNNLQGLTSSQLASSAAVNGSALTLVSSNLTVTANSSLGTQNVSANSANKKVGSYALTASTAEGVTINNLSVRVNSANVANMRLMVGSTQFGATVGTVSSGTVQSFSGTAFTIPIGATQLVDVFVDTLSGGTGTISPVSNLTGCSASGAVSLTAITCASVAGQGIVFSGQSSITVSVDSATPAAQQLVMGSTGNTLAVFRFTETSNVEDVKITDMNVYDAIGGTTTTIKSSFANVSLYNGSTLLGSAGTANLSLASGSANPAGGYFYSFHFATPVIVPQANSISLTLKGDVSSYASSGATDNASHVFKVTNSSDTANSQALFVVALGNTSNASSVATSTSASSSIMTVLRSKLLVTGSPVGLSSGRSKTATDDIATLNFAANAAGGVQLGSVTLYFSGSAPSGTPGTVPTASSTSFYDTANVNSSTVANGSTCTNNGNTIACVVQLYDPANGNSYFAVASSTSGGNNLTFDLRNYQLSAGSSKSFNVRLNSALTSPFTTAATGIAQTLAVTLAANTAVTWQDSLDAAAVGGLILDTYLIPIQVTSLSYAAGT